MIKKILGRTLVVLIVASVILALVAKKIILVINGREKVIYTFAENYGELFDDSTYYSEGDGISVSLDSKVKRNTVVTINKLKNITIEVDNKTINEKTNKGTWEEALKEMGITYDLDDVVSLDVKSKIKNNDIIKIDRMLVENVELFEEIPFEDKVVNDYKMPVGQTRIISEGENGKKKFTYKITYKNGVEEKKEKINEEVVVLPTPKLIGKGNFDPSSLTVCVNQRRTLSPNFEPQDLVVPNVRMANSASRNMMRAEAAKALENMFNYAEEDGMYLYAVSGYRSYYYQSIIYDPYSGYSAPPGASEHQLGLAMDVNTAYSGTNLVPSFGDTPEGQWIKNNAYKYGFVVRYFEGSDKFTGYFYEPWHLRYLGIPLATELTQKGITLEEYYGEY